MKTDLTLVILAAGMGSRYGGLKQLDPMGPGGETVLDYSVYDAVRAGFNKIVFVIRRDIEEPFRETIGSRYAGTVEIRYAFQDMEDLPDGFAIPVGREKPWGTGHAVRAAQYFLKGPFAVINADDFYGADAYRILSSAFRDAAPDESQVYMVGYSLANTLSPHGAVNRGICSSRNGRLESVQEVLSISRAADGTIQGTTGEGQLVQMEEDTLVSMNFWGFRPGFFQLLEKHFIRFLEARGEELESEFYITTLIDTLISGDEAECSLLSTTASWFGVTYPEDKQQVQEELLRRIEAGEYPSPLEI